MLQLFTVIFVIVSYTEIDILLHPSISFFRRNPEENEGTYWYDQQNQNRSQQATLYPHNTYHGATQIHHRTPLSQADFKPIRFTDSAQYPYVSMTAKTGSSMAAERIIPTSISTEPFSYNTRRTSNESNSDEEVRALVNA